MQSACASRKRRGKTPRQIRYISYYEWTLNIMKIQQEDWYKVSPKELCEALQKSYCNVSLVVNFGRFAGKSLQQKFLLCKVALDN